MVGKVERSFFIENFRAVKATGACTRYENEHWTEAAKVPYHDAHAEVDCTIRQLEGCLLTRLNGSDWLR